MGLIWECGLSYIHYLFHPYGAFRTSSRVFLLLSRCSQLYFYDRLYSNDKFIRKLKQPRSGDTFSNLVRDIKSNSTNFINSQKWFAGKFSWQTGFGAFTYSKFQVPLVIEYIQNQEKHHYKKTFKEEYLGLLNKFGIEYKHEYLFQWYEHD